MNRHSLTQRTVVVVLLAIALVLTMAACGKDSTPGDTFQTGPQVGDVDTDKFEGMLTECEILPEREIAAAVGGRAIFRGFNGAICRWLVSGGAGVVDVTLNWFEWGNLSHEKETAKRLGFETENIQIESLAAFTQRDRQRPGVCGVTAKSPGRGILTWWVEPQQAPRGDACAAPIKLMELVMDVAA